MRKKRLCAGLLALQLVCSAAAFALTAGAAYTDNGVTMTRLQYADAAYEMLLDAGAAEDAQTADRPFTDTDAASVSALYHWGILKGTSDKAFSPADSLTREEAAVILDRLRALLQVTPAKASGEPYRDDAAISDWASGSVYALRDLGLMLGTGEGKFSPADKLTDRQGKTLLTRLQRLARPAALTRLSYENTLDSVADESRWSGTPGEQAAAKEIAAAMRGWGYEVTEQPFDFTDAPQGKQISKQATNVIAVKKANRDPNGDILVISAHHDSMPSTVGADDNASGTAMLLELARALKDIETDTELRFISFSAEEQGLKGSTYYTAQLSDAEKTHIVGDIQIDMIGHYMSDTTTVKTTDGAPSLLGNMLLAASKKVTGNTWPAGIEGASDHMAFQREGIPGVLVEQDRLGTENHKWSDRPAVIDPAKALPAGQAVAEVVREIASAETGPLAQQSQSMLKADSAVTITDRMPIFTGMQKYELDVRIGAAGAFEKTEYDDELGWQLDNYVMNAKWFGWSEALPTDFVYRRMDDGLSLYQLYIRTADLKLTDAQLAARLTDTFGQPETVENSRFWGANAMEQNPSMLRWMIDQQDGAQVLTMVPVDHTEVGVRLKSFDFNKAPSAYAAESDMTELTLLKTIHKIVPPDDKYVKNIVSWTDGYSSILGMCVPQDMEKLDAFDICIDRFDCFDGDGSLYNMDKMLTTMIHEYGHALTTNSSQIDPAKFGDNVSFNNPAAYRDGSYLKAFYDQFYAGGAASYIDRPENYVDEYASSSPFEDIAETFMVFVTGGKPTGSTMADQKVAFFYGYPELQSVRSYIRTNFAFPAD